MTYTLEKAQSYIENNLQNVNHFYQPKFHACPQIGWMNDPNGVIYFNGKYHVFYQYHPYTPFWGPMHWGHFVSRDLLHFEHAAVALAPDNSEESGCFSGGAIVNTNHELVLMYTQHYEKDGVRERQNIAVSQDGFTFVKKQHSVLTENHIPSHASKTDFRDPRPIQIGNTYYVLVGSKSTNNIGQILVYSSHDLQSFEYHSTIGPDIRFGEMGECPDLFTLDGCDVLILSGIKVPQQGKEYRKVNSSIAFIGKFDLLNKFYRIDTMHEIDIGHDFYAPQTLLDGKGRRIMVAWMNMWGKEYFTSTRGHNWAGAITLPRVLSVKNQHLYQKPIDEIDDISILAGSLKNDVMIGKQARIILEIDNTKPWALRLANPKDRDDYYEIGGKDRFIYSSSIHSQQYPQTSIESRYTYTKLKVDIIIDASSIEVFLDSGKETITTNVFFENNEFVTILKDSDAFLAAEYYVIQLKESHL